MFKNYIAISFMLILNMKLICQTNPATARRDWFVGYYQGILKDSSVNITVPCSFNVYWTQNHPTNPYPMNDSTVTIPIGSTRYVVCVDSTFQEGGNRFCTNWPNTYGYGRLKADSNFMFIITSSFGCMCTTGSSFCSQGDWMVFRGKKLTNIPLNVYEPDLESNSAVVFPNPAQEHVNVLTFVEFDAMEL